MQQRIGGARTDLQRRIGEIGTGTPARTNPAPQGTGPRILHRGLRDGQAHENSFIWPSAFFCFPGMRDRRRSRSRSSTSAK